MAVSVEIPANKAVYRYYVAWTLSGDLAFEYEMAEVSFGYKIRRAGEFTGKIGFDYDESGQRLIEAYWGTMPGKMSVYVTRNSKPIWGGVINRREYNPIDRTITIGAVSFESVLYRRVIWHDMTFSNTVDQYAVVRGLIAQMQTDFSSLRVPSDQATPYPENASIGLTVESRNLGKTQDTQTWLGFELTTFGDAIENFSNNLNGFEYNIHIGFSPLTNKFTKQLVFRDTPPSQLPNGVAYTGTRPGLESNYFEYPGNIIETTYSDTADDTATRFFVTGAQPEPVGDAQLPTPRGAWENAAYLATQFPILEAVESSEHSDVSVQATLDSYAKSYGQRARPPAAEWTVVTNGSVAPEVGTYFAGDWCNLVFTDPFMSQGIESNGGTTRVFTKRIAEYSVAVPDTNQVPELVQMTLIDEWDEGT